MTKPRSAIHIYPFIKQQIKNVQTIYKLYKSVSYSIWDAQRAPRHTSIESLVHSRTVLLDVSTSQVRQTGEVAVRRHLPGEEQSLKSVLGTIKNGDFMGFMVIWWWFYGDLMVISGDGDPWNLEISFVKFV